VPSIRALANLQAFLLPLAPSSSLSTTSSALLHATGLYDEESKPGPPFFQILLLSFILSLKFKLSSTNLLRAIHIGVLMHLRAHDASAMRSFIPAYQRKEAYLRGKPTPKHLKIYFLRLIPSS